MSLKYNIIGDDMQGVILSLQPGDSVRAEVGAMLLMNHAIEMQTNAKGGLLKGLGRMITGESFFITNFSNPTADQLGQVGFSAPYPGKIIPINLDDYNGTLYCQRDAFLCSEDTVDIEMAFTKKIGAGLFGGEGFVLQKLTGSGLSFIHTGGTHMQINLKEGETMRIDTGCLVAFSETVDYDIQLQKGFKNMLFGGEGLFLAHLKGPGTVILQTLPFSRIADRILSAARGGNYSRGENTGLLGIANSFISGD